MTELEALYEQKRACDSCGLRKGCTQVVVGTGCMSSPALMVIGEAPSADDDIEGEPFVGQCGQILREAIRNTKILNRTNTLISNVIGCRPPKNKFPTNDNPDICMSKWLWREIELAQPKRMLLLGNVPLKYVAGMEGITSKRGQWYNIKGIRTMMTYHPSYILRTDKSGMMHHRLAFEGDIMEVAMEIATILGIENDAKEDQTSKP